MITVDDLIKAVETQNEDPAPNPQTTAERLDFDEDGMKEWCRKEIRICDPGIFAGAIGLGIEIERARQ